MIDVNGKDYPTWVDAFEDLYTPNGGTNYIAYMGLKDDFLDSIDIDPYWLYEVVTKSILGKSQTPIADDDWEKSLKAYIQKKGSREYITWLANTPVQWH